VSVKQIAIILGCSILLIALSVVTVYHHPWISLNDCYENPEKYDGKLVTHFREPVIAEILDDGFILKQYQGPSIKVFAETTNLKTGEFVGLKAIFHKEGYLEAVSCRIAKNRRYKIWLSVIPVVLVAFFLFQSFQVEWKTIRIRVKDHA